ncbi:MAG: GntR family transcriptional regulator [Acidobacteriota bacterium]
MIQIATGDARPIFQQIVDGLRLKIATGELGAGTRLPSVRGLAMQLTINPNTVARAYTQLAEEGLIVSQKGVGVFVAERRQRLSDAERRRRLRDATERFVHAVVSLGFSPEEILDHLSEELELLETAHDGESHVRPR